jgi:selenocysteine-specific elongation factor
MDIVNRKSKVLDDGSCLTEEKLKELEHNLVSILEHYHSEYPLETGMKKQLCQQALKLDFVSNKAFNQFLSLILSVKVINDRVKLNSFTVQYNKEEQETIKNMIAYLNTCEFKPPSLKQILEHVRGRHVKSLFFSLIKMKALIKIDEDVVLTHELYEEMMKRLDQFFNENDILAINDIREMLNTSRKYTIAYLEYLDKVGYTRRTEEGRVKK